MTATAVETRRMPHDEDETGIQKTPAHSSAMVDVASTRAAQEVQAAMVVAKKFPRDVNEAFTRIMTACKRKKLAEQALYAYPRGKETVTGPSIRLAEALAQNWGNTDFGIIELEQRRGESTVMAYAWDLETNTRQTKIFQVPHVRHTRSVSYALTDPRDIYELVANQGARRLRACILGVIPGDIVESAVESCEKTMASGNTEPLQDRVRKMVSAFHDMGVSQEQIEKRLGHKLETTSETEVVQLRKIYVAIKDNMAQPGQYFEQGGQPAEEAAKPRTQSLADKLKAGGNGGAKPAAAPSADEEPPQAAPET